MPQLQNLVLTDRTTPTPVDITFTPREVDANGVGVVVKTSGVPIGEKRATVSMKPRGTRYQGQFRLSLPVVATETINGVESPVILRTAHATLSVDFDQKSTEQERNDLIGMVASALATSKTLVNDAFVKLESIY